MGTGTPAGTAPAQEPSRGRRQVIVNATAAAATIRTATVAESTVMQVASLVTSHSRRALKAARRGGTTGIAGRESTGIGWLSSTQVPRKRPLAARLFEPSDLLAYSAALARKAAMSMMKPEANQTSSVGMTEIMGHARAG
jgi:hypothetical protein